MTKAPRTPEQEARRKASWRRYAARMVIVHRQEEAYRAARIAEKRKVMGS